MIYIIIGIFLAVSFIVAAIRLAEAGVPRTLSMKGSIKFPCVLLIIFTLLLASCASTTIKNVWKDKAYKGKAKKMVVIMVARVPDMRKLFEGRFVAELEARGNKAVPSYNFIALEELSNRELVKSRIKDMDADTVLISRLVDSKTVEAYMPGHVKTVPLYYDTWGTYYGILFVDYGYKDNLQLSYIETNIYDVKTEKLIWFAHSKTERTEGEQQLINTFINVIVKKLSSDKIIQ